MSRRAVLRTGGLLLGGVGITAASALTTPADAAEPPSQRGWSFCHSCYGIWWPGAVAPGSFGGHCAGSSRGHYDGNGTGGSYDYIMWRGSASGMQGGWRWCSKCRLLHYGSSGGLCAAGGGHNASGYTYYLDYNGDWNGYQGGWLGVQPGWDYCSRCRSLWYAKSSFTRGCPGNGAHRKGSTDYYMWWSG